MTQSIFNLALDFFRSPSGYDELVDPAAPLPPDISSLLDAIAGQQDPSAADSVVISDEMRAAISFLIEQSFFIPGADYYRVLGLNRGCASDQIRRHYNQLMHIFLLGGEGGPVRWDTNHAMLVNRAYSVLRDPEQRRAYDQGLQRPPQGKPRAPLSAHPGANPSEKISYFPGQGEVAPPVSSGTPVQRPDPGSSYLAHSIDRVSSVPGGPPDMKVSMGVLDSPGPAFAAEPAEALFPVDPAEGGWPESFPRAIPMMESERHHHSPVKSFLKSVLIISILAAIFIAVAVYILGEPAALKEDGDIPPTADVAGIQVGSVARDTSVSETPAVVGAADPVDIPPQSVPDLDRASEGSLNAPGVSSEARGDSALEQGMVTPVPGAVSTRADAPDVSGRKPVAVGAGGGDMEGKIVPPPAVTARKSVDAGMSPARKLESMRSTETVKKPAPAKVENKAAAPDNVVPAITLPPVEPKVAAKQDEEAAGSRGGPDSPVAEVSEPKPAPIAPASEAPAAAPVPPPAPAIGSALRAELDLITATFSRAYETGDLPRLMGLFAADASTNDQSGRQGIEKDYRELFEQTDRRAFVFERVDWKADAGGGYVGDSVFHVYVNLKGQMSSNTLDGRVTFHVQRRAQGLVITRMIHTYD